MEAFSIVGALASPRPVISARCEQLFCRPVNWGVALLLASGPGRRRCRFGAFCFRGHLSKEHGLRDALEAGSTLRAAYDRFGVL